ncbi:hypothetical protein [Neobacillus terrae]|nr:hypothetical protein [Neobacillus terrae]NHM32518.1 hypothetical protein [Neobacillus terrae]
MEKENQQNTVKYSIWETKTDEDLPGIKEARAAQEKKRDAKPGITDNQ